MALRFPNQSRSYDAGKRSIRFIGHDGVFEVSVFVEVSILQAIAKEEMSSEDQYLEHFDSKRSLMERSASKSYSRRRRATIVLTAAEVN
ncbi:DUF1488 family protein [uncultured Roseibium sp.]|uniref:DUF1488 family protein n=1 Tax=uncultured Roseibium sp. TaxID=1936171 RepID=UPI00262930DA|nr:DUF1488 family protein [uncultured Roseibium sp.]